MSGAVLAGIKEKKPPRSWPSQCLFFAFPLHNWDHFYLQTSKAVIYTYNMVWTFPMGFFCEVILMNVLIPPHDYAIRYLNPSS